MFAGKRALVISSGVPHPTEGASTVLFFYYIQSLRDAGFQVRHLMLVPPGTDKEVAEYRARMEVNGGFAVCPVTCGRLIQSGRFTHRIDATILAPHRAEVEAFAPDLTLCLDIAGAWALKDWSVGRRVVWLGDLFFENYFHNAHYAYKEKTGTFAQLILSYWHVFLWKRIYHHALSKFDFIVASAGSSVQRLAEIGLSSVYLPYPWPASSTLPTTRTLCLRPTFFFFGNLVGLGSRSAFHLMAAGIYPELIKLYGPNGFEIRVSGRGDLPHWVTAMIADKPEVRYLGFVEDLDPVMSECHALLVPIDVPVGNRSRIVTALSKRLLVVAHANTALGNPDLVDGQTCYLASEPQEFVAKLKRAVDFPEQARHIAENGYDMYRRRFAPEPAVSALLDAIKPLLFP